MAKFNMSDFAKTLGAVPELGTRQIEYIDIDLLHEDPRNFYEVSGVDELASNIALFGLMDPLLVRSAEDGTVQIVSGHRRHAALRKLVDEGRGELRQVPCIRVQGDVSPALQELQLIYANSDTRKMTSADIAKQAERVEQLLYQLKEEGQEFPGRMRDHVAEACKISKSKLSRLHAIQNNLASVWVPAWERGELKESSAYALSQLSQKHQEMIYTTESSKNSSAKYFYERTITGRAEWLKLLESVDCKKCGGKCTGSQVAAKFARLVKKGYEYNGCEKICCSDCSELGTCKAACSLLKDRIAELKADAKEQKRQEKLAQEAKDAPTIAELQELWARFGECRSAAGKTVKQFCEAIKYFYGRSDDEKFQRYEDLTENFTASTQTPFQYRVSLEDIRTLKAAADLFGVSLDYLLCRTDDPSGGAGEGTVVMWQTGTPPTDGPYYVKADHDGFEMCHVVAYNHYDCRFEFLNLGEPLEGKILGWYPLPADDK